MHVEELSRLTHFVAGTNRSFDEVCKFLVLETFRDLAPKSIFVGEIDSAGYLRHQGSFGFSSEEIGQWSNLSLGLDLPITRAVTTNKCIIVNSAEDFYAKFPVAASLGVTDVNWKSCIAVPVLPYGVYFLVLNGKPKKDLEFESFLRIVGQLLTILQRTAQASKAPTKQASTPSDLTPRQKMIMSLLSKGFTNPQIAQEIGYSESLVRQETIAIYACLNVSGRKELIQKMDELESAKA